MQSKISKRVRLLPQPARSAGQLLAQAFSLTCNSTRPQHTYVQLVLIIGFKSLPELPGVQGFIVASSSSNSHPNSVCNFRTLSTELDSNADDQYSLLDGNDSQSETKPTQLTRTTMFHQFVSYDFLPSKNEFRRCLNA